MKATYDRQTDTLTVILRDGARVTESDEDKPGVVLDYDDRGNLVLGIRGTHTIIPQGPA